MGGDYVFVVLGAHVRVLTAISNCHFNANFAMFCFDESDMFLDIHVELTFVLTPTVSFDIYSLSKF